MFSKPPIFVRTQWSEPPDIDPRQVVHLPCDGFASRDLRRALILGREFTRVVDQTSPARRVWLLDEVSAIRSAAGLRS